MVNVRCSRIKIRLKSDLKFWLYTGNDLGVCLCIVLL